MTETRNTIKSNASATATVLQDGWSLHLAHALASTNSSAARLPPWHAVRAAVQTNGRGRTGRPWVSDEGGLWLSAVLPCAGAPSRWSMLPLAIGWAIIGALHELGAPGLRLRWPNDIMAGHRKLAGLLVERYTTETAVAGIGLNVFNSPESADASLAGTTTRLAELQPACFPLDELTQVLLRSLRRAHAMLRDGHFPVIARELNAHWAAPRHVALEFNGSSSPLTGLFRGIDDAGRVRITIDDTSTLHLDPSQVAMLRELE